MIVARQFTAWNELEESPLPSGTARLFIRIQGTKLPGYLHAVPTGLICRPHPWKAEQTSLMIVQRRFSERGFPS